MKLTTFGALALAAAMAATLTPSLQAQQQPSAARKGAAAQAPTAVQAAPVTPVATLDYYEIHQVYTRLNHALDSAEDGGKAFATLFTADGVLVAANGTRVEGRDQLAAFARQDPDMRKGPTNIGHYVTNVALETTPAGARGHGYLLEATQLPPAAAGRGPVRAITEGAAFYDELVRTPEGWRIRMRTLVRPGAPLPASVTSAPVVAAPATAVASASMPHPFTAQDYADITQLFSLFGYTFDSASENGYQWANLYTPDGVFVAGTVVSTMRGRETLASFAAGRLAFPQGFVTLTPGPGTPHNPLAIAHILTDVVIDPAPEGAIARVYRMNAGIGNDGRGALGVAGVYHVLLARTTEGWRFKENWYVGPGAPVQDGAKRFLATMGQPMAATVAPRDKAAPLTVAADDDAAIRQLYARFSHALDSGADNGAALARLFTPDGSLVDTWTGRAAAGTEQLTAMAREAAKGKGATNLGTFVWTVKLEASPQGTTGKAYVAMGSLQEPGKPFVMTNGGQYWDDLVKTADGWRFKKRVFYRSSQVPPPAASATN